MAPMSLIHVARSVDRGLHRRVGIGTAADVQRDRKEGRGTTGGNKELLRAD